MPRKHKHIGGIIGADPVVPTDEHWDDVTLLLDGESSLTDKSSVPQTITPNGGIQVNTTTKKFGTGSIYFDGTDDYLDLDNVDVLDIAGGDWTIECWIRPGDVTDYQVIASYGGGDPSWLTSGGQEWVLMFGGTAAFFQINNGGGVTNITAAHGMNNAGNWYHIAATRSSGTIRLYVDGSQIASSSATPAVVGGTKKTFLGVTPSGGSPYEGYIDDLRITKGVARYTSNFTPPAASLPATADPIRSSGVSNLGALGGDGASTTKPTRRWGGITGRSLVENTAASGEANWSSVVQLFDGAASGSTLTDATSSNSGTLTTNVTATGDDDDSGTISAQPNGTSLVKFDSTGGYVNATASSDFAFGTGAFTVETWVYITQTPTSGYGDAVFDTRTSAYGAGVLLFVNNNMKLDFFSNGYRSSTSPSTLSLTTWHHIALTRDASNNWTTYVDGTAHSASTYVTDLTQNNCFWGAVFDDGPATTSWRFTGFMTDMRVTKGVARDIAADWAAGVYTSALPQGPSVAAAANLPTTGVLNLAEHYQSKL